MFDHYETVAASQTAQQLGSKGGVSDRLAGLLVVPATTGANVSVVAVGNFT